MRTLEDQFTLADVSVRNASDNVALSSGATSTTPGRGQQASVMEHLVVGIMPVHERGLRQMATRVIEHSITHILPDMCGLQGHR
jgi:hypothetical protein